MVRHVLLPTELYRYRSFSKGLEILQKQELWFASLANCNDPFEFAPSSSLTEEMKKKWKESYLAKEENNVVNKEDISLWDAALGIGAASAFILAFPILSATIAGTIGLLTLIDENDKEKAKIFFEKIEDVLIGMKVCCFSSSFDDIRMWSHYADNHKGMVITFKTDVKYWGNLQFRKIKYTSKRLAIPEKGNFSLEYVIDLMTRKYKIWQSEKEWRILNLYLETSKQQ